MIQVRRSKFDLVADTRDEIGESPIWCGRTQSLVWTDIAGRRLHRLDTETGQLSTWSSSLAVGCLALAGDGGFIAATDIGFATLRLDTAVAAFAWVAPILVDQATLRFNDGRCDRRGRFLAASMAWAPAAGDAPGGLWRLEREATPLDVRDLIIPNGIAFSPSGDRLYLSDSHPTRAMVWTLDYDVGTGAIANRRPFIDMRDSPGRPDGATVDTDGCYWIAATDAGEIRRYTPAGMIDLVLRAPVRHPTTPVFGGRDLRTLYVASARRPGASPMAPDGGVFALDLAQQGIPETPWRGGSALT